jgi:tetratricopeptide (TPR) repeat protein
MKRALILAPALLAGCAGLDIARFEPRPVVPEGYAIKASGSDLYEQGKRQLQAGHAALAIDAFRRASRAQPDSIDALNGLAVAYDRIGRYDLSRRYYEAALGREPTSAMLLHNLGFSLALQGKRDEGRELIEKALASGDAAVLARGRANLATLGGATAPAPATELTVAYAPRWIERTSENIQTLITGAPAGRAAAATVEMRYRHVFDDSGAPRIQGLDQAIAEIARSDEVTTGRARRVEMGWVHSKRLGQGKREI